MARERFNKEVKTHLNMVAIYDKFQKDFKNKYDTDIVYSEVTRIIAQKISSAGGVKV